MAREWCLRKWRSRRDRSRVGQKWFELGRKGFPLQVVSESWLVVHLYHSSHLAMVQNLHLLQVRSSDYYYAAGAHRSLAVQHKILLVRDELVVLFHRGFQWRDIFHSKHILQERLELISVHMSVIKAEVAVLCPMSSHATAATSVRE